MKDGRVLCAQPQIYISEKQDLVKGKNLHRPILTPFASNEEGLQIAGYGLS